jgi:hypothetical protein
MNESGSCLDPLLLHSFFASFAPLRELFSSQPEYRERLRQAPGFSHPNYSPELPGFSSRNLPRVARRGEPALYPRLPICVPPPVNSSPDPGGIATECARPHGNIPPTPRPFRWRAAAQLHRTQLRSCNFPRFRPFACGRAHPLSRSACGRAQIRVRPRTTGGSISVQARAPSPCHRARSAPRREAEMIAAHRVARPSIPRVTWKSNLRNNHTTRPPS